MAAARDLRDLHSTGGPLRRLGATRVGGFSSLVADHNATHNTTKIFARSKAVRNGLEVFREDSEAPMRPGILRSGTDHRTAVWNVRQQEALATEVPQMRAMRKPSMRSQHRALIELQGYDPGETARLLQASTHLIEEVRAQIAACHHGDKSQLPLRSYKSAPELVGDTLAHERQDRGERVVGHKRQSVDESVTRLGNQERAMEDLQERLNVARDPDSLQQLAQNIPMSEFNGNMLVHVQALERARKPRSYYLDRSPGGSKTGVPRSVTSALGRKMLEDAIPQTDFILQNQSSDALSNFRLSRRVNASQKWAIGYEERSVKASERRGALDAFLQVEKTDPKVASVHRRLAEVALGSRTLPLLPAKLAQIHWLTAVATIHFVSELHLVLKKQKAIQQQFDKRLGLQACVQATWRAKRMVSRVKRRKGARKMLGMAAFTMLFVSRLLSKHRAREAAAAVLREYLKHQQRTAAEREQIAQFRNNVNKMQKSAKRLLLRRSKIMVKLKENWDATERRLRLKNGTELTVPISTLDRDKALRLFLDGQAARKGKQVLAVLADTAESAKTDVSTWWFPRKEDLEALVLKIGAEARKKSRASMSMGRTPSVNRHVTYASMTSWASSATDEDGQEEGDSP